MCMALHHQAMILFWMILNALVLKPPSLIANILPGSRFEERLFWIPFRSVVLATRDVPTADGTPPSTPKWQRLADWIDAGIRARALVPPA